MLVKFETLHDDLKSRLEIMGIRQDIEIRDEIGRALIDYKNIQDIILANNVNNPKIETIHKRQANYLTEEIMLSAHQGQLTAGVIKLFNAFAANIGNQFFPAGNEVARHAQKRKALNALIEDIQKNTDDKTRLSGSHLKKLLENDSRANLEQKRHPSRRLPITTATTLEQINGQSDSGVRGMGDLIFLPPDSDLFVIGDTHGDPASTQWIIDCIMETDFERKAKDHRAFIIFLGDYVNNGLKSVENLIKILKLKNKFPYHVVLLNGNHEFRESYLTAFNEFFTTHWENALQHPFGDKIPPNRHYGHIRLELIRRFGVEQGEDIYEQFKMWGRSLPHICFASIDDQAIMMSHTIGKAKKLNINLVNLADMKSHDHRIIDTLGYEAWKKTDRVEADMQHAAMVNNRMIDESLLREFDASFGEFDRKYFLVGHTHYRSGDIRAYGDQHVVVTIASSHMNSPDAGHYMYQEMHVARNEKRATEGLSEKDAVPGFASFTKEGLKFHIPNPASRIPQSNP